MCLVPESDRFDPFIYAKCLNTLDHGECCDALFYLRSSYWLNIDELTVLSALLSIIITDLCPS
jgi:hypothetical protein